ncbi:MAG: hypothetical protein HOK83_00765, partial [Rhodospirillaceae bacterium]|nr:hypothetical protein [Rhodospirillaceae bacterium]
MSQLKRNLLSTTVLPAVMGAGAVLAIGVATVPCGRTSSNNTYATSGATNPEAVPAPTGLAAGCSACDACSACNPCAA